MAIFLETQDVYRMLQRESPEGVYPDGAASGSYSAASYYSKAELVKEAYDNMEIIYDNFFPQTAEDKIVDWENKVFGYALSGSLSLAVRRDRVIQQIRKKPGITVESMLDLVKTVIGSDKLVEIAEWGCADGGWQIGLSELGVNTIMNGAYLNGVTNYLYDENLCDLTAADIGVTEEEFLAMRESAYTYSVLIYGYELTDSEYNQIDNILKANEPARSQHFIYDGLNPEDMIAGPYAGDINLVTEDGDSLTTEDGDSILLG